MRLFCEEGGSGRCADVPFSIFRFKGPSLPATLYFGRAHASRRPTGQLLLGDHWPEVPAAAILNLGGPVFKVKNYATQESGRVAEDRFVMSALTRVRLLEITTWAL